MKYLKLIIPLVLFVLLAKPGKLMAQNSSHTVKKGETLFNISKKFGVSMQKLKQWNELQGSHLEVGQRLIVRKGNNGKQSSGEDITGNGQPQNHTVQKGETLFSISKDYHISIAELKSWNNITSNNLNIGQTLTIYPSESPEQATNEGALSSNNPDENAYYVVKNNDSLFGIAKQHHMTVKELKNLNDLTSNTIAVGQKLTVSSSGSSSSSSPSSTEVIDSGYASQGDFKQYTIHGGSTTIDELIEKFRMSNEEFEALNPDITSSTLSNGHEVTVLAPPSKDFKNPYVKHSVSLTSLGTITASPYQVKKRATPTTSGELYNPKALTAAHANIALGSIIYVENPSESYGVFVRINDRTSGDELKLSAVAWKALHLSGSQA